MWHPNLPATNVWRDPPNHGPERIRDANGVPIHPNQKPMALMDRIIEAASDPGDVVWEPFAGLATGTLVATRLGRSVYAAEIDPRVWAHARERLQAG